MPTVSVILPTYNRGHLLMEAVQSVVAQTWADWELIIVDDGSTDDSLSSVAALGDQRIRTITIPHSGSPARARNVGVAAARGEWVAFLDSDDLWLPLKLERQLAALRADAAAQWSTTGFAFIDENGAPTHQRSGKPYEAYSGWIFDRMLTGDSVVTTPAVMARRTFICDVGEFDESLMSREDLDLMLRMALNAPIAAVVEPLTLVREHPGRTTKASSVAHLLEQNARVYTKAAAMVASPKQRTACRRLSARNRIEKARVLSRRGQHRDALIAIVAAARDQPTSPTVWRAAAGCVIRGLRDLTR
jgi:glycosyltransferase involved in cell wall biosynthesis